MTPEDEKLTLRLLEQLDREGVRAPDLPHDLWHAIAKLVPMFAVEVFLADPAGRVLMVERHDECWSGWNVPGGFVSGGETLAQSCARTAEREVGLTVELDAVFDSFAWPKHPYGVTTSLLCSCRSDQLSDKGRYYETPPADLTTPYQAEFFERYRSWRAQR